MMAPRWLILSLVAAGLGGCSKPPDGAVDTSTPAYKEQASRIEQFKDKAAKRNARPAR